MRRRLVAWTFVAAVMTSLGSAPSVSEEAPSAHATVAVQRVAMPYPAMRDEAAMVLVGTALIALAAALRRAA